MSKIDIKKYDLFFFDCDGVIVDSNPIKAKAFSSAVSSFGEVIANEFENFCKKNWGKSRHFMFDHFIQQYCPGDEKQKPQLLSKYEDFLSREYFKAPLTNGVKEFLLLLENKEKHVVSGGAEHEVKELLRRKEVDSFFHSVQGSPATKEEIVSKVNFQDKKVLFIGDSIKDFDVATLFNFDFLFVRKYSDQKDMPLPIGRHIFKIESFEELV